MVQSPGNWLQPIGGGYLDIVLDFLFYAGVVFGFSLAQPEHGVYAAALLFAFMGTASSFLAFAIFAPKARSRNVNARKEVTLLSRGINRGDRDHHCVCTDVSSADVLLVDRVVVHSPVYHHDSCTNKVCLARSV